MKFPAWLNRMIGRDISGEVVDQKELDELRRQGSICKAKIARNVQRVKKATQAGEFHAPTPSSNGNGTRPTATESTTEEPIEEEKAA